MIILPIILVKFLLNSNDDLKTSMVSMNIQLHQHTCQIFDQV